MKNFGYLLAALLTLPSVALARPPIEPPASELVNFCATLSVASVWPLIYAVPVDRALTIEYGSITPDGAGWGSSAVVAVSVRTTVGSVEGTYFAGKVIGDDWPTEAHDP